MSESESESKSKSTEKKSLRRDIIVVGVLLAVGLLFLAFLLLFRGEGVGVHVDIDGKCAANYRLDVDGEYVLGDGSNVLVIEDGAAYMKSANCPDKTCVGVGKIKHTWQSIVCLPNRVIVTIISDYSGAAVGASGVCPGGGIGGGGISDGGNGDVDLVQ